MSDGKSKILVLVEGAKTDVKLMQKLFEVYGISERYEILSYNTNIYTLYREMFSILKSALRHSGFITFCALSAAKGMVTKKWTMPYPNWSLIRGKLDILWGAGWDL